MRLKRNWILVFGYFGYVTNQLDGQTVKTRAIFDLIKQRKPNDIVKFADTQEFRHSVISILRFLIDIIRCNRLIWLPAHNNLRFLFPVIWVMSKVFRFEIIYIVIGGWLSVFLEGMTFHQKKLKGIKAILLENKLSYQELKSKFRFNNLDIIPNFRETASKPIIEENTGALKLVFMARVNKMKGIDTIAEVANRLKGRNINIDIYGPIFVDDEQYFRTEVVDRYSSIAYKGVLQPDKIHDILKQYDIMLFPTHYYTEGFPGSIMDAYRSALPVIATDWKHAREFIVDGVSGYIANFENPVYDIVNAINSLDGNRPLLRKMRDSAYQESLKYTPDECWKILENKLR